MTSVSRRPGRRWAKWVAASIGLLGAALFLAVPMGGPHGRAVIVNVAPGDLHVRMWTGKEGEEPEGGDLAWEGGIPSNNPIEVPFKIVTPGYLRIEFRRENMSEPAVWEEYMMPTYVRRYFYVVGRNEVLSLYQPWDGFQSPEE